MCRAAPRWWFRKILNSPPLMDTRNLQLRTDHFPLHEIWKLDQLLSTAKDKRTMWRQVEEAESTPPTPQAQQHTIGRDLTKHVLLPEKQGIAAPHGAPQPWGSALGRWVPRILGLENQWDWHLGVPMCYEKESPLEGLTCGPAWPKTQWGYSSLESAYTVGVGPTFTNLGALARGAREGSQRGWKTPSLHFPHNLLG